MKATALAVETATPFVISFDFTSADQRAILKQLQDGGYKLLGFKGASGPTQISAGLPTWFAEPFNDMFGQVEIDYEPLYKVFVYNKAVIAANTTIQMQALSDPIPLGSWLVFNQDGSFATGSAIAPNGSIVLNNNTAPGTPDITVGLAALVNGEYLPFCAFNSTPQGAITMTPHEEICLFAAQTDLVSGSVTGVAVTPGCEFSFSAENMEYDLAIAPSTFQIISAGGPAVTPVSAGSDLLELLNS